EDHVELNTKHCTHTDRCSQKLEVHMSWWGMTGLDDQHFTALTKIRSIGQNDKRSVELKVAAIAEAGFDGINGFLPLPEDARHWRSLLEHYDLSFSVNAYP